MAIARAFSVLYNLVAQKAQDQSAQGLINAQVAINDVIKEITREFKLPGMLKGIQNDIFVSPVVGVGPQNLVIASDMRSIENVWYIEGGETYELEQATSDEDWIESTDETTSGDPEIFRVFPMDSAGNNKMQIWPSPNSSFIANALGQVFYSYWAQLVPLVADADVPNIPYELDTILVNGGVLKVCEDQGDDTLINIYGPKYEDDKGAMRSWITKQNAKDGVVAPDDPPGVYGRNNNKHGYRIP